ncbi:cell division control protein [Moniliophthora roreri MCA 2997]|uniref:Cell division control protein n=2 Tax=Moniliophthora roreri TaxID=221103 RepID=V2WX17_MONRO|nr:cell division control protein [Moniliophthora roreri MCA 2997]KAI3603499.1 cell division control protein [Moniliophthora roreri]
MECEGQLYARHLFPLRHGYALWIPEPNDDLPTEYSNEGVRIGDVGIVTDDGGFDFLFNICVAADNPVNQRRGVPSNFTPVIWDGEIFKIPMRFRPGFPICSRRAKQRELAVEASVVVPGAPISLGGGIEISFQRDSGAVLMPPDGASRTDCVELAAFREYAERNAQHWYQYVSGTRRRDVENGSIYLVTGFDKTNAWETALFSSSSSSQSCSLIFTTGGITDGRMKLSRSSLLQTSVSSRCSVSDAGINQTLFIRGFRTSIRQGPTAWLRSGARTVSTYSSSANDIFRAMGRFQANGSLSRGGRSGNSNGNDQNSSHFSPSDNSSESAASESECNYDDSHSDTSTEEDDFLHPPQPYHPLNVINDSILQSIPEVDVVVTHDHDWMALLTDEDTIMPDRQTLIQRFHDRYNVSVTNGIAVFSGPSCLLPGSASSPSPTLPSPTHHESPPLDNLRTPCQLQQHMQLNVPEAHAQIQAVSTTPAFRLDLSPTLLAQPTHLARNFLALLPPELASYMLRFLPLQALVRMTQVSWSWKEIIDGNGMLWQELSERQKVWYGGESEAAFERSLLKRRIRICSIAASTAANALSRMEATAREDSRNSTDVEPVTPPHSHQHTPSGAYAVTMLSSQPPHPYKILYKSRHLTRTKWMNNPNPRHISFPAHGHSVVTCLIFTSIPNPLPPASRKRESDMVTGGIMRIISASDDHCIHVYDPRSGKLEMRLEGHEGGIWALAARGGLLVSGSTDRTVRIWDLTGTGDSDERDVNIEEAEVEVVDTRRDEKAKDKMRGPGAASGGGNANDSKDVSPKGRCIHIFGGHTSTVRSLAIVEPEWIDVEYPIEDYTEADPKTIRREKWPKRPLIVTGSRDHSLRVWTLPRKGEEEYKCYSPGVYDADENPYHLLHLEGHEHAVRALAARGRTLVSGSYDCTVRVWDIVNGVCRWVLIGHTQKVYSVVLDPARKQTMSGSMDGTVRIWSTSLGQCLHVLTGHTSLVGILSLSPTHLVSAAADSTLRIWDPDNGELKHVLAAHTGAITCSQHDEFKIVSGSDGTLKVWDLRGWEEGGRVSNHNVGRPDVEKDISGTDVASIPVENDGPLGLRADNAKQADEGDGGVQTATGYNLDGCGKTDSEPIFVPIDVFGSGGDDGGMPSAPAAVPPLPAMPSSNGARGMTERDLLTDVMNVWQVAFEGRWCVAASNKDDQTVLDIWDFGKQDGGDLGDASDMGGDEYGDENGMYEEGWIGEPPGRIYDEDKNSEIGDEK